VIGLPSLGTAQMTTPVPPTTTVPPGTAHEDRPGGDYRYFGDRPDVAGSALWDCYNACQQDARCHAWTMVNPRVVTSQGPWVRCWMKDSVPAAVLSSCCLSGVIEGR
jgi:PAN domain